MIVESLNYHAIIFWLKRKWARSFFVFLAFFIGMWVGGITTESRIIGDCKFAGAFRVDIQAFACQRRI